MIWKTECVMYSAYYCRKSNKSSIELEEYGRNYLQAVMM